MFDLRPAATQLGTLVQGVGDGHLDGPTPCQDWRVADLLAHIHQFATVFTLNARKEEVPDIEGLPEDWRTGLPRELAELAEAWRADSAWQGRVSAGGIDMDAEQNALVAVEELVLHGWDLARATGQDFEASDDDLGVVEAFQQVFAEPIASGDGPYGPPVAVSDDSRLHRLLGAAGRDPAWMP